MNNVIVVGKCSLCGGNVTIPKHWMPSRNGPRRPLPKCFSCGAKEENLPIIKMTK